MNKTKIEWCTHTWNPVVGCKHGCSYCYAKKLNTRFKWIKDWEKPKFFKERLAEPYKVKKPSKIFVGSMCDLFGDWVNEEWIEEVILVAEENPRHTFMFLTKNPKRYYNFTFPKNCWLGATITDVNKQTTRSMRYMSLLSDKNYTFISAEPLLGSLKELSFVGIDLIIIGAMTGRGAIEPERIWLKQIKHKNIFYKDNIKKYL